MKMDPEVLLHYTNWANDQVYAGACRLSSDDLNMPIRPGFLSSLELLVHMLAAEQIWLARMQGRFPETLLTVADVPSLAALKVAWGIAREALLEYVRSQDDFGRVVVYRTTKGMEYSDVLWQVIIHLINHSTEHRSQLALYLAARGIDVGNLDLIMYLRQ